MQNCVMFNSSIRNWNFQTNAMIAQMLKIIVEIAVYETLEIIYIFN